MTGPVVWFEVMGQDADKMRAFYGKLFGWEFDVREEMGGYGLLPCNPIPGGVGGGVPEGAGWAIFYIGVPDVQASLDEAVANGATVLMPPRDLPGGTTIAVFADPEGHAVGIAKAQPGA